MQRVATPTQDCLRPRFISASRPTLLKVLFCLFPEQTTTGLRVFLQRLIQGQYLRCPVAMAIGFVFNSWPVYSNSCGGGRTGNGRRAFFFFLRRLNWSG